MRTIGTLLGIVVFGMVALLSQTASTSKPSFEVATVKLGDPAGGGVGIHLQPGGRFNSTNTTLKMLIAYAYSVNNYQIEGASGWIDSDPFTIDAKADSPLPVPTTPGPEGIDMATLNKFSANVRLMLQSFLAERFNLVVHSETKDGPVYELVIAKGGHKLRSSDKPFENLNGGRGQLTAEGVTIAHLSQSLSQQLGRSVVDKTGLSEKYDFTLTYTPEARDGVFGQAVVPDVAAPIDPNVTSIFTALQEQLGLRLESAKGPIQMLIIDHAEKPAGQH